MIFDLLIYFIKPKFLIKLFIFIITLIRIKISILFFSFLSHFSVSFKHHIIPTTYLHHQRIHCHHHSPCIFTTINPSLSAIQETGWILLVQFYLNFVNKWWDRFYRRIKVKCNICKLSL